MIVNVENIREFVIAYQNKSELARRAGIDRTYLYRILNGERKPGLKFAEGMLRAGMKKEDVLN